MYINKIDKLIDLTLDNFYNILSNKKNNFEKILKDNNFVKNQKLINSILIEFQKTIDEKKIREIVNNKNNINRILQILKRYISFYLFLTIGFFYGGKKELFINNTIEFTKNQSGFDFKVNDFFNSENNSLVIRYYDYITQIKELIVMDQSRLKSIVKDDRYIQTIKFLNEIGQDFITKNFILTNLKNDKNQQAHNIIKTIIFNELYVNNEKKEVYRILSEAENQEGTFTFIDIVMPTENYIDYQAIENILNEDEISKGIESIIYSMLKAQYDDSKLINFNKENKIQKLLKHKIVVPIVDDFLLYHKDTETYEKNIQSQTPIKTYKKKENTRLKYIIKKIEQAIESNNTDNKTNIYYQPLSDRNAVLKNNNEDLKIISKLENYLGKHMISTHEYAQDLLNYRVYPYHSFNKMSKEGFTLKVNSTINAIRYVNIDKKINNNTYIQYRVANELLPVNIVGLLVPHAIKKLQCLKIKDIEDIKSLSTDNKKIKNGYYSTLKFLQHKIQNNKDFKKAIYWLFDTKTDKVKMETYEKFDASNNDEIIKTMISEFYDDIQAIVKGLVIQKIDQLKNFSIDKAYQILNKIEQKYIPLDKDNQAFVDLEKHIIYKKSLKEENKYDKKDDDFPGLFGDVRKLPEYKIKNKNKIQYLVVDTKHDDKNIIDENQTYTQIEQKTVCQHFITWDKINSMRKKNPSEFNQKLFEFIQQYLIESFNGKYICKSCSTELEIYKYVTDGVYDRSTGSFVSFTSTLDTRLEEIPKYEKYRQVIINLDKIIERLGSAMNLSYYTGSTNSAKSIRRRLVKQTIDFVLLHNQTMKTKFKNRKQNLGRLYSISEDLTRLFIFDLENSIYVFTSEEKDYYKSFKQNNILSYMIISMIVELNESQINQMIGDNKICNYYFYKKIGVDLFDKIKIITNNKKDTKNISNYNTLCYVIYFISCIVLKYNMWNTNEEKIKEKKGKINRLTQKIVVHTITDILNSLLEIYSYQDKDYQYEIFGNKFLFKLQKLFSDDSITDRLNDKVNSKIVSVGDKKKFSNIKIDTIKLSGIYKYQQPQDYKFKIPTANRFYVPVKKTQLPQFNFINNLSNSKNGEFYNWIPNKGSYYSKEFDQKASTIKYNVLESLNLINEYKTNQIKKITKLKCSKDNFEYVLKNNNLSCDPKHLDNSNNIVKIYKLFIEEQEQKFIKEQKLIEDIKTNLNDKHKEYKTAHTELKDLYPKNTNYIENFINKLELIIGKDTNINNLNIFLKERTYIINHDQYGNDTKNIILKDKNITIKKEHGFFKRDVLYYTNYEKGRLDIYYDLQTRLILGFKEQNKDYVLVDAKKYIKINYSVTEMINLFGYDSINLEIRNKIKELQKEFYLVDNKEKEKLIIDTIVSNILRNKTIRIKKLIKNLQRNIYRIKFDYKDKSLFDNQENIDPLDRYRSILTTMEIRDKNKKNRVFKKSEQILNTIYFKPINSEKINIDITNKFINAPDLNIFDKSGNLLLFYMLTELTKLLDYNDNKFNKKNIAFMLINIFIESFNNYNVEFLLEKHDLKRFTYMLELGDYATNITESVIIKETDEETDEEKERYDAEQEMEGLDIDHMNSAGIIPDDDEDDTQNGFIMLGLHVHGVLF